MINDVNNMSDGRYTQVHQRAIDAGIDYAHLLGLDGIRSGDTLISAPKTYRVWEHYPHKTMLNQQGMHNNSRIVLESIDEGKVPKDVYYKQPTRVETTEQMMAPGYNTEMRELWNGPVYSIQQPSELSFPVKTVLFDPTIIDKTGKMNIVWGKNSNLINSLLPPVLGGTYLFNQK